MTTGKTLDFVRAVIGRWIYVNQEFAQVVIIECCRGACSAGEKTSTIHVNDGVIRLNRNGFERNQRGLEGGWLGSAGNAPWERKVTLSIEKQGGQQQPWTTGAVKGKWKERKRKRKKGKTENKWQSIYQSQLLIHSNFSTSLYSGQTYDISLFLPFFISFSYVPLLISFFWASFEFVWKPSLN